MNQTSALTGPVFFAPNRVWRCYAGGALLDRYLGRGDGVDGDHPEEWLASLTRAENGDRARGADEGLSRVRDADGRPGQLFRDVVGDERMPVLCKLLDSAVRLPIQCHPDRAFARAHYGSPHGKTECWLVLETRAIAGVEPYLLLGFRPGVAARGFAAAVDRQDVAALEGMLNRIPVRPGDAYLVPGRLPHAIGPGVLMLEVQEPSDWVVQVERDCAGTPLSERDRWGPLAREVAMACFDVRGEDPARLRDRLALRATSPAGDPSAIRERLEAATPNDAFAIERLRLAGGARLGLAAGRRIGVVTAGRGSLVAAGREHRLAPGETWFSPARAGALEVRADPGCPLVVHLVAAG